MKLVPFFMGIALLYATGCGHSHQQHSHPLTLTVSTPELSDTVLFREFIGQVRAIQHIELRALEEGYLQSLYVDEGQHVRKGQLLFQILPLIYRAERQKALAEFQHAQIEYQNTRALADSNIVSPNELALAKATLDMAQAELELADAHLQFTEIRAPFDGIIGRFHEVRAGSLLEEGELLTTLSDNSNMWVYFNVPEATYLDYVGKGNPDAPRLTARLKMANGAYFGEQGVVEAIAADFNSETGNIAFRATFPNPDFILRHGQTGNVYLPVELNDALLIPQKATYEILDKKFVYLVKGGVVEARQITVGSEMPHLYQVLSGLNATDTLLVDGLRKVRNGDRIHTTYTDQASILRELHAIEAE